MKQFTVLSIVMLQNLIIGSTKAQPGLTKCSHENSLCDFDYKTG